MATAKKKEVKVRDLKPSKDAKGGFARQTNRGGGQANRGGGQANRGGGHEQDSGRRNLL